MFKSLETIGSTQRKIFPEKASPRATAWHSDTGRASVSKWAHQSLAEEIGKGFVDTVARALRALKEAPFYPEFLENPNIDPRLLSAPGHYIWMDEFQPWVKDIKQPFWTKELKPTYNAEAVCKVKTNDTIYTIKNGVTFRGQWLSFSFGQEVFHTPACLDLALSRLDKLMKLQHSTLPLTLRGSSELPVKGNWSPSSTQVSAWSRWWSDPNRLRCHLGFDEPHKKG